MPRTGSGGGLDGTVNPLVRQRADAQVFRHTDGSYYMTGSVPEYNRLVLRRSPRLAALSTAAERVLWRHQPEEPLSGFIWAPEMHLVDGRWTMWFAAGPSGGGEDVFRIRTYAVVCDGADPMTGNWSLLGQLKTDWDSFTLDSTSFVHGGQRYLAWTQREFGIETNSNLYLAPLATPLTLAAPQVRVSMPTLEWEVQGFKVNEAPAVLQRHGRLFLTYSASATDARCCMGMFTASADADIMKAASWSKSPVPVYASSPAHHVYGPGHNSFTTDEHGRDMLVYHARDYDHVDGDPLFDPNRHTPIQPIRFGELSPHPGWGLPRRSRLTAAETRTTFALWAIARSPLILGGDLTRLDGATRTLVTDAGVLALDQEARTSRPVTALPPALAAARVWTSAPTGRAVDTVAVFNTGETPLAVDARWEELGATGGRHAACDLIGGRALPASGRVTVTVPAHDAALLRLGVGAARCSR